MPNPGGNNTLQSVSIDRFVSAEPSADEREQWAEWQLCQFDMPVEEVSSCFYVSSSLVLIDVFPCEMHDCHLHKLLIALFLIFELQLIPCLYFFCSGSCGTS